MNLFISKGLMALKNKLNINRLNNFSLLRKFSVAKSFPSKLHSSFVTGFTDAEGCFLVLIRKSPKNKLGWQPLDVQSKSFSNVTDHSLVSGNNSIINHGFITGFTDGEGSFLINVYKDSAYKTGWRIKLFYQIHLHRKDQSILAQIKNYFNVGKIYNNSTACQYYVSSVEDLQIIIQHFNKYALLTKKQADFELLKQAYALVKNKEHLTIQGLEKIIAIKASMNNGLSEELKANFPKN